MPINNEIRQAFLETDYWVQQEPRWALQVGARSEALASLMRQFVTRPEAGAAFITACNPFSQSLNNEENERRHRTFGVELQRLGLRHWEGMGQHPTNGWPGEASHLVLNLSLDEACDMGRRLEQNAILWAGSDAVPCLVELVA